MSGALRFFGVAALIGGLLGGAYFALEGDFRTNQVQLLVLGVALSGVFWFVLLLAAANVHEWMHALADHHDLLD